MYSFNTQASKNGSVIFLSTIKQNKTLRPETNFSLLYGFCVDCEVYENKQQRLGIEEISAYIWFVFL